MEISDFTRHKVFGLTERLLQSAGVAGVFPTPLEAVERVAGVAELVDIGDLPAGIVATKPNALRRILGAYLYRTNTIFVDRSQGSGRVRFIRAHEATHRAIPWHERCYHLDDEHRLFRDTEELLEAEANLGASLILFQGTRFHERALDYENSIRTPIALAPTLDASIHATIRYYVEHHPDPLAVLLVGHYPRCGGVLPVWRSIESPSFTTQFGSLATRFPGAMVSLVDEGGALPWSRLARAALTAIDPPRDEICLEDLGGRQRPFVAEAFFNQRCVFLLVTPRRWLPGGRRLRLIAS